MFPRSCSKHLFTDLYTDLLRWGMPKETHTGPTISLRLPIELHEQLAREAEEAEQTVGVYAREKLSEALRGSRLPHHDPKMAKALQRWEDDESSETEGVVLGRSDD